MHDARLEVPLLELRVMFHFVEILEELVAVPLETIREG